MPNSFPRWKYYALAVTLILGFIYAIPNLYGEDPAVQVSNLKGRPVDDAILNKVNDTLEKHNLKAKSIVIDNENILLARFSHPEIQLKAKELIKNLLGDDYSVALNLASMTPRWLEALGAKPMKLGLDLRGGVHFLMEVDINSIILRRIDGYYAELPKVLRESKLRYQTIEHLKLEGFKILFTTIEERNQAYSLLQKREQELALHIENESKTPAIVAKLSPNTLQEIRNEAIEQTIATLRNRVNELGVAEAIVQRQGLNQVIVELPGVQDTAYAKDILGKTATLKFLMVDDRHSVQDVMQGHAVAGSKIFFERHQIPVLLKTQPILTGEAITGASIAQDRDGNPAVSVRLGGDISLFSKTTRDSVGKRMAVVYVEVKDNKVSETAISVATIQSALGNNFQISGLSQQEARNLALLLRAGALPAPVSIVEESIVGPSMGQDNIRMGMVSVTTGLLLVLVFMGFYYSVLGIMANIALLANLVLLVALLSLIGATLTLPAIAGVVLTLGMAVDANVLIFERIREELRLGLSPRASVYRGYEYAFATILDSNLTTLIVGIVLFAVGTGAIKGFALTLCIGILTSLLTAVTGSRALVELFYHDRSKRKIRVGI